MAFDPRDGAARLRGLRLVDGAPQLVPSWWVVLIVVVGIALFFGLALTTMVRARFSTQTIGRDHLIGRRGVAVGPLPRKARWNWTEPGGGPGRTAVGGSRRAMPWWSSESTEWWSRWTRLGPLDGATVGRAGTRSTSR